LILEPGTIAREAELNGVKELLITECFVRKLNGATLHRLHRHRDVAVPCDEDDWKFPVRRSELALKLETALPWHLTSRTRQLGPSGGPDFEKVGNGRK